MPTIQELVQELEQESQTTRRTLARIPEDKLEWRPHERSMSLGQLAVHIATLPAGIVDISAWPKFDMGAVRDEFHNGRPGAASVAEVLEKLDQSVAYARAAFSRLDDGALAEPWRMVNGEQEVLTIPRGALFRTILFNHWYHHRGQLTVYLRLAGALVPALYGDSADEQAFAG